MSAGNQLQVGQPVMARDFRHGNWQPGVITSIGGPLSYKVTLDDGRTWNRHIDHIRAREYEIIAPPSTLVPRETSSGEPNDFFDGPGPLEDPSQDETNNLEDPPPQPVARRYPARDRKPPDRLDPSTT